MSIQEILIANELYHNGEASNYDESQPYMQNAFAQSMFEADIRSIVDTLSPFHRSLRVLDCGAGTGNLTMKFLEYGADVTAVDISENMLKRLRSKSAKFGEGRLETVHSDIDSFLQRASQRYDVICSSSFLHHLPDYQGTYGLMARLASDESVVYTAFEPRPQTTVNLLQRLFIEADTGLHEVLTRRLYNPWIIMRAVLRRLGMLPTPRNILNEIEPSLIERPALGISTDRLEEVLRTAGFAHSAICWRAVSRFRLTHIVNRHFIHLNNALFMISQRSLSGKQRPLAVKDDRFE